MHLDALFSLRSGVTLVPVDGKNQDRARWLREEDAGRIGSPGPMELVQQLLMRLPGREAKTVVHLGTAPLARLRTVAEGFERLVVARTLGELVPLDGRVDVVLADGTIGRRDPAELDAVLEHVLRCLTEGGLLAATFPAPPATAAAREMRLRVAGAASAERLPLHEIELQYRLRRSGFRGVRVLRFDSPRGARLLCLAVRRANN